MRGGQEKSNEWGSDTLAWHKCEEQGWEHTWEISCGPSRWELEPGPTPGAPWGSMVHPRHRVGKWAELWKVWDYHTLVPWEDKGVWWQPMKTLKIRTLFEKQGPCFPVGSPREDSHFGCYQVRGKLEKEEKYQNHLITNYPQKWSKGLVKSKAKVKTNERRSVGPRWLSGKCLSEKSMKHQWLELTSAESSKLLPSDLRALSHSILPPTLGCRDSHLPPHW